MLGIYDSGSGGLHALATIKAKAPDANILYRGDLSRAPYGTREREDLIQIIKQNIEHFHALGCTHILVACMTASSLTPDLPPEYKEGVFPIVDYVGARSLALSRGGRIGIVSTSRTMKEGRLRNFLLAHGAPVTESEADALVPLAEENVSPCDDRIGEIVAQATRIHREAKVDTLVLGCTHFPFFSDTFHKVMGEDVTLVPSGEVGAEEFLKQIPKDVLKGQGHIHFI